ncbi:MAG: flagellar biosynthetic protein FliO [Vicinamibacterales bacterium]
MIVLAMQASGAAADAALSSGFGLRTAAAFAIVAALLGGAVWALGRVGAARRGKDLLAIETALSLGDKRSLVIVSVEGRRLLLGVSQGGVSLVTELRQSFAETLDRSLEPPSRP